MRNQTILGETKEHYKSFKAGKHWVYCCMTVLGLGLGMAGIEVSAQADTGTGDTAPVAKVAEPVAPSDSSAQGKQSVEPEAPAKQQEQLDSQKNDTASNQKDIQALGEQSGEKDSQKTIDQSQENQKNLPKEPAEQVAPKKQVSEEPTQQEANNNKQTVQTNSGLKGTQTLATSRASLLRESAVVAPVLPTDPAKIQGVNAQVWMPDEALRHAVESSLEQQYTGYKVEDWSLYAWVGFRFGLNDVINNSDGQYKVKDLTGLQYFTNLATVDLENADVDLSTIPNF